VGIALLAAAVFLVATSSIEWVPPGNGVAAWWPAASISVLALAWAPHRRWAVVVATVFLATTAANVVAGRDLGPAAGFGLSNTLEALTVAWILVRRRGAPAEPRLTTLDDFGRFVVATLAGVAVMATGAGLTAPLPVLGIDLWVNPARLWALPSVTSDNRGASYLPLPVPPDQTLVGGRIYAQFAWQGPTAPAPCPALGWSASNALVITIQP